MPKRKQAKTDPMAAAREVARSVVARQWPELAGVEPTVTPRHRHLPSEEELARIGAAAGPAAPAQVDEYTFTFAGQVRTAEGYTMPRVARVTVDARRRVVKATTSK